MIFIKKGQSCCVATPRISENQRQVIVDLYKEVLHNGQTDEIRIIPARQATHHRMIVLVFLEAWPSTGYRGGDKPSCFLIMIGMGFAFIVR